MPRLFSYAERAGLCKNKIAYQLLTLMQEKKTNLALSADVTRCEDLLKIAEQCGPHICLLKTHIDILEDFSLDMIPALQRLAEHNHFLIFEDRKFADIGNTVIQQYQGGLYRISDWAHMINAHSLPGPGMIAGLAEVGLSKGRALILIAEMSVRGHLFDAEYAKKTVRMAEEFSDFVMGFIALQKISDEPRFIYLTPGVQLLQNQDRLGQSYLTPEMVITERLSDVIIVGRGILQAKEVSQEAERYQKAGWQAYKNSF